MIYMTVDEFIDSFYKPDRLNSVPGRRERIIADRKEDLRLYGETLISRHDSVTGHQLILHDHDKTKGRHHTRRGKRSQKRWNASADYALNDILIADGCLKGFGLDDYAESIYNKLILLRKDE